MKAFFKLAVLCLPILLFLSLTGGGLAQTEDQPLVVFIVGPPTNTASNANTTEIGLSKLADIFIRQGARVEILEGERPIPPEAKVAVLIRPLRPFSFLQVVRLWVHLQRGNNLLLAVDPDNFYLGYANANTQIGRTGFDALLLKDYGIFLGNGFLVEPWFSQFSVSQIERTLTSAWTDALPNPITEPLARFDVPVWYWGARNVQLEPFGLDSFAVPLLYTDLTYGETNPDVFARASGSSIELPEAPLELNIGTDLMGRLLVGGFAESILNGSRLIVMGDSEIFLNGFGLAGPAEFPAYPTNRILVERMVGWLLDYPVSFWGDLPQGFTWIALDGDASDWDDFTTADYPAGGSLEQVRTFADERYVYVLVETAQPPAPDAVLTLTTGEHRINATAERVLFDDEIIVGDARMVVGSAIELRLPRRLFIPLEAPALQAICLEDCLNTSITPPISNDDAPYDYAFADRMLAQVFSELETVNMRAAPSDTAEVVAFVPNRTQFGAIGRDADAQWIKVENALYSGWLAVGLLVSNGEFSYLPVIEE